MASLKNFQPLTSVSKSVSAMPTQSGVSRRGVATIANFKIPSINNEPNVSNGPGPETLDY